MLGLTFGDLGTRLPNSQLCKAEGGNLGNMETLICMQPLCTYMVTSSFRCDGDIRWLAIAHRQSWEHICYATF
jgi:hypothetical protein